MKYSVRSKDYLSRAQQERNADETARLFYSAFELRAGVEARLHEYRDAIRDAKRDNTWQVRVLKRDIEDIVEKHEKPVTIYFQDPETGGRLPIRYVPVSDELKSIVERLGDYLHSLHPSKLRRQGFLSELEALIDRGIVLLSEAVSGELLSPPMWENKPIRAFFVFDHEKIPSFCKEGNDVTFDAELVVVSKDDEGITLKLPNK
jgi:hypothetical protein